ncbi:MAG: DNA polymerase III subunit delta [Lachnospirales bacterium]
MQEKIKTQINKKDIKNAYLFYGAEKYLIEKHIDEILELLSLKDDIMNYVVIKGKERPSTDIVDAFVTTPFFAEKRVVVVKDSELFVKGRKDGDDFIEGLKDLPESTVLIFQEDKVEKNLKTYKAMENVATIINLDKADEKTLEAFVMNYLSEYSFTMEKKTMNYFLQSVSLDIKLIKIELEKLISFLGEGCDISINDIDTICTKTLDFKVFTLINVMAEKMPLNAVDTYNKLIESKESPIMILSLVGRHMKILFQVKVLLGEGLMLNDISKRIGVPSFTIKDYVKQCKNFSSKELYTSIERCLETDVSIKRGVLKEYDAVWKLILEFST